jgi:hypothetical protein
MPVEAIIAAVSFVVLFAVWVIVPTIIKKRHAGSEAESEA